MKKKANTSSSVNQGTPKSSERKVRIASNPKEGLCAACGSAIVEFYGHYDCLNINCPSNLQNNVDKAQKGTVPKIVTATEIAYPNHYTFGKFEVIEVVEDWFPNEPHLFEAVQYLARWNRKGNHIDNLRKAKWYIERKIHLLTKESEPTSLKKESPTSSKE